MLNIYQPFFVFILMSFNIVELDFNMYYSYLSEKLRSYKPDLKFLIRMFSFTLFFTLSGIPLTLLRGSNRLAN